MGVATVVPLNVSMDSPVFGIQDLFDDKGIGVGVGLDVTKEPSGKGFGDVIAIDARGSVQILDEDGIVRSSGGTHDSPLVNVLDISRLESESIDNNGEVGYLPVILLESLGTFDGIGGFVLMKAVLEVFDSGLAAGPDCVEVSAVFNFLRSESFRKSTIPSCLGCGQCLIDALLGVISFLSQGGDKGLVSVFVVDGATQLANSRASDVLGQGSNSLCGELVFPVVDEGEGALRIDNGNI